MFLTFNNQVIEFQEFFHQIDLEKSLKQCDLGTIILGKELEIPDKFYLVMIHPQTSGIHYFGIGICTESYGLKPHLLPLTQANLLILGFNNQVVAIDVSCLKIAFKVNLNSLFYYFLHLPEKQIILIVQELDIIAINEEGKELWRYGKDVITETSLNGEKLQLNFMTETPTCLNLINGELINA